MAIFPYAWFFCAAWMLVMVALWSRRLARLVERGTVTSEEAGRFLRGTAFWLAGSSLVFGAISLAAGWSDPFCSGFLSSRDLPSTATTVITLALWAALLSWVWFGRGADLLGRILPTLMSLRPYGGTMSPPMTRVVVTVILLTAVLGGAIAWQQAPRSSTSPCALGGDTD